MLEMPATIHDWWCQELRVVCRIGIKLNQTLRPMGLQDGTCQKCTEQFR